MIICTWEQAIAECPLIWTKYLVCSSFLVIPGVIEQEGGKVSVASESSPSFLITNDWPYCWLVYTAVSGYEWRCWCFYSCVVSAAVWSLQLHM